MLAEDVAEVCEAVGWKDERLHIVGFSMGGMIAQELFELWSAKGTGTTGGVEEAKKRIATLSLCATHSGGLHKFSWFPTLECIWKFGTLVLHRSNQARILHMLDVMFSR